MREFSPDNFPDLNSLPVCAQCFGDDGICRFIETFGGPHGCSFCERSDSPTAPIDMVCDYMRQCLLEFFSLAANCLPYESREGGYLAEHWDTYDLLFDKLQLDLPRDQDEPLRQMLLHRIGEEHWCKYDWLSLDYDEILEHSWEKFCRMIQHERRFFFAIPKENTEEGENLFHNGEDIEPLELLTEIVNLADKFNLVQTLPANTEFYRSRRRKSDAPLRTAHQLGPPPPNKAFRANRMNPPGIPMMYGAEAPFTAVLESRYPCITVGQFKFEREVRILDLADLPEIPGIFSGIERRKLLGLAFMHAFAKDIAHPVVQDDRIHIEYIPSQVITEYIRDSNFDCGAVDGIRYPSDLHADGRNLVLFATQDDLIEPDGTPVSQRDDPLVVPWIRLIEAHFDDYPDRSRNLETAVF